MENRLTSYHFNIQKNRSTTRVRTQQAEPENRFSYKPFKSNNKNLLIKDSKNKYKRCIFTDKLNMAKNGNIS